MSIFVLNTHLFFYFYTKVNQQAKTFNLSWMIVRMSYLRFNNLSGLLNGYLSAKIGRGILSADLMDRECNCSLPTKVNGECV